MGMVINSNEKGAPTNPPDVEVTNKIQPKTRLEKFLAKIAKREDIENLEPKTRLEYFLNKIAMEDSDETLEPKTRLEYFLADIAENCGCGQTRIELVPTDDYPVYNDESGDDGPDPGR